MPTAGNFVSGTWAHQNRAIEGVRQAWAAGDRWPLLVMPTGCHARGQLVLLFDGSCKAVEDVEVNDQLMGPDSTPRLVTHLCRGRGHMYEITPIKGSPFVVNRDHILTLVRINDGRSRAGEVVDISVAEYLDWSNYSKYLHKLFRVPIEFATSQTQTIDPYLLGVLLGDGSLTGTIGICKPDPEMLHLANEAAKTFGLKVNTVGDNSDKCVMHCLSATRNTDNPLREALALLGLLGTTSGNKFVPTRYLWSSREQRLSILAGLLDTDGHMNHGGFDFISKSKQLSSDVVYLARSLGFASYISECRKGCQTGAVGTYWRVSISGDCSSIPCRIPRKKAPARRQKKDVLRTGFSVSSIGEDEFFGFGVDGDHRYLLGDFTVTHNSGKTFTAAEICKPYRTLWLAHRMELIEQAGAVAPHCEFETIQTMVARPDYRPEVDLVVVDESHHMAVDRLWTDVLDYYRPRSLGLGLTATPARADGQGFQNVFDRLVVPTSVAELIEAGILVPCEVIAPAKPLKPGTIAAKPVDAYLKHTPNGKAIVFASNLKAAALFAQQFRDKGITAAVIDGKMSEAIRRQTIEEYRKDRIRVLLSVGVLTEGFDHRPTDTCILARAVGSQSLFLQMTGRALRSSPGKTKATLLDLFGSVRVWGGPEEPREYSLEGEAIRRKLVCPERFCLVCGCLITTELAVCAECGIARPELAVPKVVAVKLLRYETRAVDSLQKRAAKLAWWIRKGKKFRPGYAHIVYKSFYGIAVDPVTLAAAKKLLQ